MAEAFGFRGVSPTLPPSIPTTHIARTPRPAEQSSQPTRPGLYLGQTCRQLTVSVGPGTFSGRSSSLCSGQGRSTSSMWRQSERVLHRVPSLDNALICCWSRMACFLCPPAAFLSRSCVGLPVPTASSPWPMSVPRIMLLVFLEEHATSLLDAHKQPLMPQ